MSSTVVKLKDFRPHDVRGQVSNALSSLSGELSSRAQQVSTRARSAASSTDRFVRASPWQAVGVVAAVGAIAGIAAGLFAARAKRRGSRGSTPGNIHGEFSDSIASGY